MVRTAAECGSPSPRRATSSRSTTRPSARGARLHELRACTGAAAAAPRRCEPPAGSERCQLRASAEENRAAAFDRQLHGTKSNWVCAPRPRSAKAAQDQLRKLRFRHGRV